METRTSLFVNDPAEAQKGSACPIDVDDEEAAAKFTAQVVAPIITQGDPIGAVILCSKDGSVKMSEMEVKLTETAAGFLAKQMEE